MEHNLRRRCSSLDLSGIKIVNDWDEELPPAVRSMNNTSQPKQSVNADSLESSFSVKLSKMLHSFPGIFHGNGKAPPLAVSRTDVGETVDERRRSDNETLAYPRMSFNDEEGAPSQKSRVSLMSLSLPSSPVLQSRTIDISPFVLPVNLNKTIEFDQLSRPRAFSALKNAPTSPAASFHPNLSLSGSMPSAQGKAPKISNAAILGKSTAPNSKANVHIVSMAPQNLKLVRKGNGNEASVFTPGVHMTKPTWTLRENSAWFSSNSWKSPSRFALWLCRVGRLRGKGAGESSLQNGNDLSDKEWGAFSDSPPSRRRGFGGVLKKLFVKWYSLRNALALANVAILVSAVTVISVIANFASRQATEASMKALSEMTLRNVQFQLGNTMHQVQQQTLFLNTAVRLGTVGVNATYPFMQLLYDMWENVQSTQTSIENLYAATSDGYFASISQLRDEYGQPVSGGLVASFINSSTVPVRYYYTADPSCIVAKGWKCIAGLITSDQITNTLVYDPVTKSFYQYASIAKKDTWTNIYLLGSNANDQALGLTLLYPYFNTQTRQLLSNLSSSDGNLTSTPSSTVSTTLTLPDTQSSLTTETATPTVSSSGMASTTSQVVVTTESGASTSFAAPTETMDEPSPASDNESIPVNATDPQLASDLPEISGSPSETNSSLLGSTNITVVRSNGEVETISISDSASGSPSIKAAAALGNLNSEKSRKFGSLEKTQAAFLTSQTSSSLVVAASYVTATDISLTSLSLFLQRSAQTASGTIITNTTQEVVQDYDILIYIIEYPSMQLVATSQPKSIPLVQGNFSTSSFKRQRANESSSAIVKDTWSFIQQNLSPTELEAPFASRMASDDSFLASTDYDAAAALSMMSYDSGILVVGVFDEYTPDISWLIVVYIPYALFQKELGITYTKYILVTCIAVGLFSVLLTVFLTRTIAKPIKLAAKRMLKIADLDFEVLGRQDSDSEDGENDCENVKVAQRDILKPGALNDATSRKSETNDLSLSMDDSRRVSVETAVNDSRRGSKENGYSSPTISANVEPAESSQVQRKPTAPKKRQNGRLLLKEIAGIENAMSSMTSGLKSFVKYVPMDVVQLLVKLKREAVLGVDEMPLTVMFTDIANFTSISEKIAPNQLVRIMSEYLEEMSNVIIESQGVVDKYIGDAIMAFWNAPMYLENHPRIACRAALLYQKRLKNLRQKWIAQGLPAIYARIGINTGLALVGNLGSKHRMNYTCLGDAVNLASRFENLNKRYGTNILISEFTYDAISPSPRVLELEDLTVSGDGGLGSNFGEASTSPIVGLEASTTGEEFVCRVLETVAVKGKTQAVKVYELLDTVEEASPSLLMQVSIWNMSYKHYCDGKFASAATGFKSWLCAYPDDQHAASLLKQCSEHLINPPDKLHWSPAVILEEK